MRDALFVEPGQYLDEFVEYLLDDIDFQVSASTVSREVKRMGLS